VPRVCKDIIECSRLNFSKDYMLIYQKGKEYCFVLVHGIDENNTEVFMASGSEDYLEKVSEELFRVIRFFDGIDDSNLEWRDFLIELTTQCEVYRDRPGEFPNVPKA